MVLSAKFLLHLPLNRQSAAYAREGVEIDVSTLADWVGACVVALDPIVQSIRAHVLAAERIHADDTTVPVLAKQKTRTGRIWVYLRDDRPFGGKDPPAAFFEYSRSRHGEYPSEHLRGWAGVMQADAFAGFNELYDGARKPGPIVEASCWAHRPAQIFRTGETDQGADRAGGRAPHRRIVRHRARDQRQAARRTQSHAAGKVEAAGRSAGGLAARTTRARLGEERHRQGDQLQPQPLGVVHPLPRRRTHLPFQQRRRTRVAWRGRGPAQLDLRRLGRRRAQGRTRFYARSKPANSTTSIRRLGSPTCSRNCPITRPNRSPNSCRGTGKPARSPQSKPPLPERRQPALSCGEHRMDILMRHVWMPPFAQDVFEQLGPRDRVRSCIRPSGAALLGRWRVWRYAGLAQINLPGLLPFVTSLHFQTPI